MPSTRASVILVACVAVVSVSFSQGGQARKTRDWREGAMILGVKNPSQLTQTNAVNSSRTKVYKTTNENKENICHKVGNLLVPAFDSPNQEFSTAIRCGIIHVGLYLVQTVTKASKHHPDVLVLFYCI